MSDSRLWEELKEHCNYDLEEVRKTLDSFEYWYEEEKEQEEIEENMTKEDYEADMLHDMQMLGEL